MESKREIKEINASSMADIAFLLLIFFLVATTMNTDTGITRILPAIPPEDVQLEDSQVNQRNLLRVFVNPYDEIIVNDVPTQIYELKDRVKEFILNASDSESMPEKEMKDIPLPGGGVWDYAVTKGVVSLTNDNRTSYNVYIQVQNELTRAYNELRDDLSMQQFGKKYADLGKEEEEVIRTALPQQISEGEIRNAGGN